MRNIRVVVVLAALAVATMVPGVAQAEAEAPRWDGAAVAERLVGWLEGLWSLVAGSGAAPVVPEGGGGTIPETPEGPGIAVTSEDPSTQADLYPELDPNG